jgi:hypothetical protein
MALCYHNIEGRYQLMLTAMNKFGLSELMQRDFHSINVTQICILYADYFVKDGELVLTEES